MWGLQDRPGGRPPPFEPAAAAAQRSRPSRPPAEASPQQLWLRLREPFTTRKEAVRIFAELRGRGLVTQPKEFSIAINTCGKMQLWREALVWLGDMQRLGLAPNVYAHSGAISACQRGKASTTALDLLRDMRQLRLAPDQITYCTAMRACEHDDRWDQALAFLEEMQRTKLELNTILCNAAINACCKGDKWKHALSLVETMWAGAVQVDVITFSSTINACERSAMWEQALELLSVMQGLTIQSDVVSCSAAISACAAGEAWQAALHLFHQMLEEGPQPNEITFSSAISACQRARWEWSLELLEAMQRQRLGLSVVTGSVAMGACATGIHWELALELFSGMLRKAVQPNRFTYTSAISACLFRWEAAVGLLRMAQKQDKVSFLEDTYRDVISACIRAARFDLAWVFLQELEQSRQQADVNLRVTTYIAALRAGQRREQVGESIRALLDSMHSGQLELDAVAYSTIIAASSEQGLWAQMLGLIENMLTQRLRPNRDVYATAVMESEQQSSLNLEFLLNSAEVVLAPVPGSPSDDMASKAALRLVHDFQGTTVAGVMAKGLHSARLGVALPMSSIRPLGRLDLSSPYAKELRVFQRVLALGMPGDPDSVLSQVEDLMAEASTEPERLSEVSGGMTSEVLVASIRGGSVHQPVLEIGTYIGYSALQMAIALPAVSITTLEVDPVLVAVARGIIGFAGITDRLEVLTGPSERLLPRLAKAARRFGTVFMDRRGSQYDDLALLEREQGLLAPGAVVVANCVRKAPSLLWRVAADGPFTSRLACVREILQELPPRPGPRGGRGREERAEEDWMSISVYRGPEGPAPAPLAAEQRAPGDVARLHWRSEQMGRGSGRRAAPAEQAAAFAEEMEKCFASLGITVTCAGE